MESKNDSDVQGIWLFPCTSFAPFEEMRKTGKLCDVRITTESHSFSVHRVVLAAEIPFFRELFSNTGEEIMDSITLPSNLDPKTLEYLISFAYGNKLNISETNVVTLLVASHFLGLDTVFDASKKFILCNFEKLCASEDFKNMLPHSLIKELISDDDLNVTKEEIVFEAALAWAKVPSDLRKDLQVQHPDKNTLPEVTPAHRVEKLSELLCEVRMIYFHPEYLINRVAAESVIANSASCMKLVEKVKNYLILPQNQTSSELKIQPRKSYYTNGGIYAVFHCRDTGYAVHHCNFDNGRISHSLKRNEEASDKVFGVAAVGEKIYLFHAKQIRTFDVKSLKWEILKPTHRSIDGAAVASHGHMIYCIGSSASEFSNKARCFDTQKKKWLSTAKLISGRHNCAAASLEEFIYITGGFWDYSVPAFKYLAGYNGGNAVEKYNPSKKLCRSVAPMLTYREKHFSCALSGKICVVGGNTTNTAEIYDPVTNQWNYISSLPAVRNSFSFVSRNDKIYAFEVDAEILYVKKFDLAQNEWNFGLYLRNELITLNGRFLGAVSVIIGT